MLVYLKIGCIFVETLKPRYMSNEKKAHTIPVILESDDYVKLKAIANENGRTVLGHSRWVLTQLAKGTIKIR